MPQMQEHGSTLSSLNACASMGANLEVLVHARARICKGLGAKLTRKPLKKYSEKYVTQKIVRPLLRHALGEREVKVKCFSKWNKKKRQLEGKLKHKGKRYQWIIQEVPIR